MLVLGRILGESVLIGDNITVTVVRVQGNKVRLGIEAPDSVRVLRFELVDRPPRDPATPKTAASAGPGR